MQNLNKKLIERVGIYIITNVVNGKRYIGSTNNLYYRLYQHRKELNEKTHCNSHLQNAWNKYSEDSFEYGILEYCEENERLAKEKFYIDIICPEYNLNGVNTENILNHSEEIKKKISKSVKKAYKTGKLKERIENSYAHSYDCYVYSIEDWKLVKYCETLAEASLLMGQNKFELRLEYMGNRIFKKKYVVLRELITDPIKLKNKICPIAFRYITKNLEQQKYLICEKDNEMYYFRTIQNLVDFIGCSSRSTINRYPNANYKNPYIVKNTNIKIYWSYEYIPYKESRSVEEFTESQSDNIGETPEVDNTEINSEIKESESSYSVEVETI